jgi:hypothetical protein
MSSPSHEERILRHIRSIFSGRRVSFEEAAQHCAVSEYYFRKQYELYVEGICQAIQHGREWAVLKEYQILIQEGYMRDDELERRFKIKKIDVEAFLQEKANEEVAE